MAGLGLLLGGGGSVGIAWENGVLAGLVDRCHRLRAEEGDRDRRHLGRLIAVGADMALGKDPHDALALDRDSTNPRLTAGAARSREGSLRRDHRADALAGGSGKPETVARVADRRDAKPKTALSEAEFRRDVPEDGRYRRMARRRFSTDRRRRARPESPRFWTAADGLPLSQGRGLVVRHPRLLPDGVARGRALHGRGTWPPLPHGHREGPERWTAALFIGPRIAIRTRLRDARRRHGSDLEATGVRVHTILGSERLQALGLEPDGLLEATRRFRVRLGRRCRPCCDRQRAARLNRRNLGSLLESEHRDEKSRVIVEGAKVPSSPIGVRRRALPNSRRPGSRRTRSHAPIRSPPRLSPPPRDGGPTG